MQNLNSHKLGFHHFFQNLCNSLVSIPKNCGELTGLEEIFRILQTFKQLCNFLIKTINMESETSNINQHLKVVELACQFDINKDQVCQFFISFQ